MVACALLCGASYRAGFKLIFQSKCLRMDVAQDVAACVVHVLIVSSAKRESCFVDQVFLRNFPL